MTTDNLYTPITDAIVRLFAGYDSEAYDRLADFTRRNLGQQLTVISQAQGLKMVAAALFEWADTNFKNELLLVRLQQHDPQDAALLALVTELGLEVTDYSAVQSTDLKGLQAVAANPLTRSMFKPYQHDLETLCLTAIRIGGWKFLHDTVDLVRKLVLAPLTLIIKGPVQPGHRLDTRKLSTELAKHATFITDKVSEMGLRASETPWVTKRLLPAQASLTAALEQWPGLENLGAAASSLGIICSSDLSLLNGNIKLVAASIEGLNMPAKLADLQAEIVAGVADAKDAKQTGDEIQSMAEQIMRVIDHVDRHDQWQLVKDSFDNYFTVSTVAAARDSWAAVNAKIDSIMEIPADLASAHAAMVAALATDDFYAIQDAIGALDAVISTHFLAFDGDLLKAAGELGRMGASLGKVLETLDD